MTKHTLIKVTVLIRNESTKRVTRYRLMPNGQNNIEVLEYGMNGNIPSVTSTPVDNPQANEVAKWLRSQYPEIVE